MIPAKEIVRFCHGFRRLRDPYTPDEAVHFIAQRPFCNAKPKFVHNAGEFDTENVGCARRRRIHALTLVQIRAIQAERRDLRAP
jgi:hypothetical protein